MSILSKLFGSKTAPTTARDQTPTARSLLNARAPPWHRVPPIVIDAIFEALAGTELFDCFVLESMENSLVAQYEELGREDDDVPIIRAQISQILCQTGFEKIGFLEEELRTGRINRANKLGFSATNLFEPAIALSEHQVSGYIGMAAVYDLLRSKDKSEDYAIRGLLALEKIRRSVGGQAMRLSSVFPPDMLDQAERQLHKYI
jgi:hypothetical protein